MGVGTGVHLPHYPAGVALTVVELSPAMLGVARQRAHGLGIEVDLRVGDATALDFADKQFDTVVATHFLSVAVDEQRAVREIGRMLKPAGHALVLDHGQSHIPPIRLIQKALDPVTTSYAASHVGRDLISLLVSNGFLIEAPATARLPRTSCTTPRRPAVRGPAELATGQAWR